MAEPTVEELQAKILELSGELEKANTDKQVLSDKLNTTESSLSQARKLNSDLMTKMPMSHENPYSLQEEPEEHKETVEEFLDSFIEPARQNLVKLYGVDKVANHN